MIMNDINTSQVQSTNDASTVSKCSAVSKNYFKDDFIQEFVGKKKSRASLIHLGYYARAAIMHKLITDFIESKSLQNRCKIISCGSGFDTTYWRLLEAGLLNESLFIEIDFSDVIKKKILLINQSPKLRSYLHEPSNRQELGGIHKLNNNYYLLEADLSDIDLIEKLLNNIYIEYDIPTLFLSECAITYMKEAHSRNLIKWMAVKFKNSTFINYEQIHPEDGFGKVMLKHFYKLRSTLFSVSEYPTCESHYFRCKNLGFKYSFAISEWDALICLTTQEERQRVLCLELFDEFEEFHMKCTHYVVAIAEKKTSDNWNNLFQVENFKKVTNGRRQVEAEKLKCDLKLFRLSSCYINGFSFVFGGSTRERRSSKIYKISYNDCLNVKEIQSSGQPAIELDMVCGSITCFEINGVSFVCLYGGRASPDNVWNNGSPVIFEYSGDQFLLKLVIKEGNPTPRYRTQIVSVNSSDSEAVCWIFGGRMVNLNEGLSDLWQLTIKPDCGKNLTYRWKQYEKKTHNWPCSRMSHSFTPCPKRSELYISGGLRVDSSSVLNDMWKWSWRSESWEEMELAGKLLPRYGHTAHLKDNTIYLVGGVNTLAGLQPCLAIIDLKSLSVVEFAIGLPDPDPFLLFNHSSEIVRLGENDFICIFGGGGNCFSFGTHLNSYAISIKLSCLNSCNQE